MLKVHFLKYLILVPLFMTMVGAVYAQETPATSTTSICCSNILFLPGFEGSRLTRNDAILFGSQIRNIWEPYTNNDVKSLYLDSDGKSLNTTIRVTGIVDKAYGIKPIYSGIFSVIGDNVVSGIVNQWQPFSYDWRMFVPDVVNEVTPYLIFPHKLIDKVQALASTSKTGKVTIVAHSNGGLVAKMLVYELEKQGKAEIVDKVLLIAVPQLGTPEAIAAMLHGSGTQILGGLVMSARVAREWGKNMLGSYGLLPSAGYFSTMLSSPLSYGGKILKSYGDFSSFITGTYDNRSQPDYNDLKSPVVLSASHVAKTEWMHEQIDTWNFPTTTQVVAIAGWGIPTMQSIEYASNTARIHKNPQGDGVVVTGSAFGNVSNRLYFNTSLYNTKTKSNISHTDILEAEPIKSYIRAAVASTSLPTSLPPYISKVEPTQSSDMKWITVSVHSPVDMDIYDDQGNHMGLVPLATHQDPEMQWFDNTIGGHYSFFGDEKYFIVPAQGTYSIKLKGTDVGNFTFQVQKFSGLEMKEVANVVYENMLVTPLFEASTTLTAGNITPTLSLDVDGDGVVDGKVEPNQIISESSQLESMRKVILSLNLEYSIEKRLIKKLDKVLGLLGDKKRRKAFKEVTQITRKINSRHWKTKQLGTAERQALATLFEELLDGMSK